MVIHRNGERNEDGGPPDRRQFTDRACARARDHEVRVGEPVRHVGEERRKLALDLGHAVERADAFDLLFPHLLHHLDPRHQGRGQLLGNRQGHQLADDARALAAAGDEDVEFAVHRRKGTCGRRKDRRAHGIADREMRAAGRQEIQPREAAGHQPGMLCELPVHAAEDRILFMDDDRRSLPPGRSQRREGGIAAETGDQRRAVLLQEARGFSDPGIDLQRRARNRPGFAEVRGGGLDLFLPVSGKVGGIAQPARIRNERRLPAARAQLVGKGPRGEHVATRPACGDDDQLLSGGFSHTARGSSCLLRAREQAQGRASIPCRPSRCPHTI